jgi:hypothetical protein
MSLTWNTEYAYLAQNQPYVFSRVQERILCVSTSTVKRLEFLPVTLYNA